MSKNDRQALMKAKLKVLMAAFVFMFAGLAGRMLFITMAHGQDFERRVIERSMRSQVSFQTLHARRGQIYDRNGQLLASTYIRDNIVMDIRELHSIGLSDAQTGRTRKADTLAALHTHLHIPMEELLAYFALDAQGGLIDDTHWRIIARDIDQATTAALMAERPLAISAEPFSRRNYVHTALAPQVLGFVRGDSSFGLERAYAQELEGRSGRVGPYSAGGIRHGYSLVTTLDSNIQQFAEQAARNAGIEYGAEAASVIVMNPHTGEVVAMAQYPSFDNNNPDQLDGLTSPSMREELYMLERNEQIVRLNTAWNNFALSSSFEPGSIFKPIIAAAAYEEGLINQHTTFFCPGYKIIAGERIPCWHPPGHGTINLTEAMAFSCNVAMMYIAEMMGPEMFHSYMRNFGYGARTGIDLPAEASFAAITYTEADLRNPVQLATSSIGQGSNSTAIQNITAFAALINGGYIVRPFVVSQVLDAQGSVVHRNTPEVMRSVISRSTSDTFRNMMVYTVTPEGTGRAAMIEGYSIAGKTGTGQQGIREENINSVSFISYFPAENPLYITMVFIHRLENFVMGQTAATPTSRTLMEQIIRYRGIQPDGGVNFATNPLLDQDGFELQDLQGMDLVQASRLMNELGLSYNIIGNGFTVERTLPIAGQRILPGSRVFLHVEEAEDRSGLVPVPDVTGLDARTASDILATTGLSPIVWDSTPRDPWEQTLYPYEEEDLQETQDLFRSLEVYEQMPQPAAWVPPGLEVMLRARE